MKIGQKILIPGDKFCYEVVYAHEKRASIEMRRVGSAELVWIIEDDLPLGTIIF